MRDLRKGTDANSLEIIVDDIEVKPYSRLIRGVLEDGVIIKVSRYNLDGILCQMIDDYGSEKLIDRIKSLD